MNNSHHHFLLICWPGQGHINPTLHLAHQLIRAGARVTFATTIHGFRNIKTFPTLNGLSFATFSDGFDDGIKPTDDPNHIMSEFKQVGPQTLTQLILSLSQQNNPVTFLIYTIILPWASLVARDLCIPSAFFCIQSATAFAIYNHYFNKQQGMYENYYKLNPPSSIKLQGLPPFSSKELPEFLLPTSPHALVIPTFLQHIQLLEEDPHPCVLLNTVDALEEQAISAIGFANLVTIGPLVSSAFFQDDDGHNKEESFCCDLLERSNDYLQWLDSKQERSVVYVSFGSITVLKREQITEILHGLLEGGRPFLWTIRYSNDSEEEEVETAVKGRGITVTWCSQVEVLRHRSVGCFMTHCGWNSTMESLAAGVPVVCCPQFSDQTTNAKLVEEVWGNGLRAKRNEDGIIGRKEIKRCVEEVMAERERGEDIKRNAMKWKNVLREAAEVESSPHSHLKQFLDGIIRREEIKGDPNSG